MPKRDGSPTKGEARAMRRAERDAANSGLDYAQRRLRIPNASSANDANAAQIERSPTVAIARHFHGVRDAAYGSIAGARARDTQASIEDASNRETAADANDAHRSVNVSERSSDHASPGIAGESQRPHATQVVVNASVRAVHERVMGRRRHSLPAPPPAADVSQTPPVSSQKKYLAPPIPSSPHGVSEVVEAAGVGLKVKPPQVDDAGDIRWVMENMHAEDAEGRAPSRSALAMLLFARLDNNTRVVFVRDIFGKVFVNKNAEEQERRERKRLAEIGEMVERCLGMRLRVESELCEPEWPVVTNG